MSLHCARCGLLVGPSSGANIAGTLEWIKQQQKTGQLEKLRNAQGNIHISTIACDTPFPYIQDYFNYCDACLFPHLETTQDKLTQLPANPQKISASPEISCPEVKKLINQQADIVLYDIRAKKLCDGYHIEHSIHCP